MAELESLALARRLADVMLALKASDVTILDLDGISDFVDAFVVATAEGGARHGNALAEGVWQEYKGISSHAGRREGASASGWLLIDCGDVVVHVMSAQVRQFYALEDLWGDAPREERGKEETDK